MGEAQHARQAARDSWPDRLRSPCGIWARRIRAAYTRAPAGEWREPFSMAWSCAKPTCAPVCAWPLPRGV